jgi:hypothetical protein
VIEHLPEVAIDLRLGHGGIGHRVYLPLLRPAAGGHGPGLQGGAVGHPVQVVAHLLRRCHGAGLACQDEEGGLEGVLGVLGVTQHPPAHSQHHRPMPRHQLGEGRLVPPGDEASQQLGIAGPSTGALNGPAQVPEGKLADHVAGSLGRHALDSAFLLGWKGPGAPVLFPDHPRLRSGPHR